MVTHTISCTAINKEVTANSNSKIKCYTEKELLSPFEHILCIGRDSCNNDNISTDFDGASFLVF